MKIVVIGGSGLIGSKLVNVLRARGHDVLAASPNTGVNTVTGAGLADALTGAQVVVDVANSPSVEGKAVAEFFESSGRNLLAAEAVAGVRHHIALSVVGTERLQGSDYFRGKMVQENLIRASAVAYTIVHSTQFFEFMGAIANSGTDGKSVRISPALVQAIASDDVVAAMADVAVSEPANGIIEVAGPEQCRLSDMVRHYLGTMNDPRQVIVDQHARYFGVELNEHSLVPGPHPRVGVTRFDSWLTGQRKAA